MKPVVFHKGDFYTIASHDCGDRSEPIFMNDGSTEFIFHELQIVKAAIELLTNHGEDLRQFPKESEKIIEDLIVLKYKLERCKLPKSCYRIGDVDYCDCYKYKHK